MTDVAFAMHAWGRPLARPTIRMGLSLQTPSPTYLSQPVIDDCHEALVFFRAFLVTPFGTTLHESGRAPAVLSVTYATGHARSTRRVCHLTSCPAAQFNRSMRMWWVRSVCLNAKGFCSNRQRTIRLVRCLYAGPLRITEDDLRRTTGNRQTRRRSIEKTSSITFSLPPAVFFPFARSSSCVELAAQEMFPR